MTRFTLRDLFWLMLVVGLCVGWWVHVKSFQGARHDAELFRSIRLCLARAADETCGTVWVKNGSVFIRDVRFDGTDSEGAAFGFFLPDETVDQP
jgi:hypothetical protein